MKLHVANLSPKVTDDQIKKLFASFGRVLGVELNPVEGGVRTAGSAVVEMHPAEAITAIKELNGKAFRNRRIYITVIADSKKDDPKTKKPSIPAKALKQGTGKP